MLSLEIMPPLMFGGLVVFLLIGFPVAFSLAAVGLFFGVYAGARLNQLLSPVQAKRAFAVFLAVVAVRLWVTAKPR